MELCLASGPCTKQLNLVFSNPSNSDLLFSSLLKANMPSADLCLALSVKCEGESHQQPGENIEMLSGYWIITHFITNTNVTL